ncbi:uncharacterized protein EV154DRAFT_486267 [Mucor mucedo]|uniref:uncharacterized protein n=1 Tax=Mucor mucedo TaxID=29922 RepID=UPI00222105E6|nr:uncharacterized protein EV154DRAFT_486267 [Mucor mucedo]KAI7877873.1 hypothetical protein EV154DRAFT_486267 [Mucor mucedo]
MKGDGSYLVFIQKGKPVPTKGVIIQVNDPYYIDINLEILQLERSTSTVPNKYALLHGDSPGMTYNIDSSDLSYNTIRKIGVEYEHISNHLSIKVSRGCMSDINDYIDYTYYKTVNIIEPLTLTYI